MANLMATKKALSTTRLTPSPRSGSLDILHGWDDDSITIAVKIADSIMEMGKMSASKCLAVGGATGSYSAYRSHQGAVVQR